MAGRGEHEGLQGLYGALQWKRDANLQSSLTVVTASLIGATIEWYDFFLYGVVAGIVFNKLDFPTGDPLVSTMLAYT